METPLEKIEDYIKSTILDEVNPEGLLKDVKSTKTTFKDLKIIDVPSVWIYLGEWNIEEESLNKNNSRATLIYNVEISVITNKPEVKDSDVQATSIQSRIVESVIKNWKRVIDKDMHLQNPSINIQTGYNDGKLQVMNKQERVVIKGVLFQFKFLLDWIRCMQLQEVDTTTITENDDEQITDNGG